jgi:N-methylhydantoinase A/oxoprolinase/acetone carboxylase beta subunit
MTELVLGIDTGGTYTDGALFDRQSQKILRSAKSVTTHHNLSICILDVLDKLLTEDPKQIRLVSISTTLATNAIAEGKGRPVGLFLLGYDQQLVKNFKFESRFATPHFYYIEGGHDLNGKEQAPLDISLIQEKIIQLNDDVDAFAISGYFSPFNASHEELAYDTVHANATQPVVLGHQLALKLDSIQRATTAVLNASLLAILKDFMISMRSALDERGVKAPLMVVRGDGALMSVNMVQDRPVETVHSGPAASAIGARFLSGVERALVIDIGGTTTDIAVLDHGRVNVSEEGTSVGPYRTAVRAANIRSIGLGGDSMINFDVENNILVGPNRVVPLSYLAHTHPEIRNEIIHVENRIQKRFTAELIEYWFLQREPERLIHNSRARQVVDMLSDRPRPLTEILERLEIYHPIQFGGSGLIREEIIGRAALTPTDLLHVSGEFSPWDREVAIKAANLIASLRQWSIDQLIDEMKKYIAEKIAAEVVTFISGQSLERRPQYAPVRELGEWLFEENLYDKNPYLGSQIFLKIPIVGIGAPANIFLPRVAEILHCDLILPENYQIANAIGTVAGNIIIDQEAWIIPQMKDLYPVGYVVQLSSERKTFSKIKEAIQYGKERISELALSQAIAAGAADPSVEIEQIYSGAESYRFRATASGNPSLSAN